ncbi:hypothetical protein CYLTODRAFT_423279 [Cylindrobasidium torrendii FP15055 ss-10]|uniref:Uncharacterized protein n=1 Tax=Cylindrobasidium torrendii FP15055 ss-10 TaxID=1314674 RepID=A0A0D7B8J3_9AGAR|nr:hypothetical protein CYLTODRAFT_423279 [Cylindrobasidium torrendii FP15055 ss-10]
MHLPAHSPSLSTRTPVHHTPFHFDDLYTNAATRPLNPNRPTHKRTHSRHVPAPKLPEGPFSDSWGTNGYPSDAKSASAGAFLNTIINLDVLADAEEDTHVQWEEDDAMDVDPPEFSLSVGPPPGLDTQFPLAWPKEFFSSQVASLLLLRGERSNASRRRMWQQKPSSLRQEVQA